MVSMFVLMSALVVLPEASAACGPKLYTNPVGVTVNCSATVCASRLCIPVNVNVDG